MALRIRSQCSFQWVIWCGWWIATQYNKLSASTSTEIVLNDIQLRIFVFCDDVTMKQINQCIARTRWHCVFNERLILKRGCFILALQYSKKYWLLEIWTTTWYIVNRQGQKNVFTFATWLISTDPTQTLCHMYSPLCRCLVMQINLIL